MKAARRGSSLLAALLATAFSAALFQDVLVAIAGLVLAALVVFEAVWMIVVTRRPGRWYSLSLQSEPAERKSPLHPGDSAHDSFYFNKRVGGNAVLRPALSFLKLSHKPVDVRGGAAEIEAEFRSPFAGEYRSETVKLDVAGPLGLFNQTCALPANFEYSVYPRTLGLATTSAKLLGVRGMGDIPIERAGIGTEFYDIREYQAGDDLRQINWKATARRGKLITNERMREVGGTCYLVLEAVSPDYFDRDRLAATFLGIANTLTIQGSRFGFVIHDGERVKQIKRIDAPTASLAFALKVALEFANLERTTLEEELPPASSYALRPIRKSLAGSGPILLHQIEDLAISEKRTIVQNQEVPQTVMELIRENANDPPSILYVSGLFGPIESIIELGLSVKRTYGANFVVANPTEPWVAALDEDGAYQAYSRYARKTKALRNAAVDYHLGEPSSLVQRLLSP